MRRTFLVSLYLSFFLAAYAPKSRAGSPDTASQSSAPSIRGHGFPSDAIFLKRAIVSSLAVRSVGENSQEAYDQWKDNIYDLLVLFDRLNSPDDLKTFASLSAYYTGEAAGGLYACIALRKGPALKPYLLESLKSGRAECENRFADATRYDGLKNSACPDLQPWIQSLLDRIQAGDRCSTATLKATVGY